MNAFVNEVLKLVYRRRLLVAFLLPTILSLGLGIFAYSHAALIKQSENWRPSIQLQLNSDEHMLPLVPSSQIRQAQNQIQVLRYQLAHNVSSQSTGPAASDATGISMTLVFPLVLIILGGDIISSELSDGTIKGILLRPLGRRKIFVSKFLAVLVIALLIRTYTDMLGYLISHCLVGGWLSFSTPVLMGDDIVNGMVNIAGLHVWPYWAFILLGYALNAVTMFSVSCVIMLISTVIKSPAMAVSTCVITFLVGGLLDQWIPWDGLKYFPMSNLDLVAQVTGASGAGSIGLFASLMTLIGFCVPCGLLAYWLFVRRDFSV